MAKSSPLTVVKPHMLQWARNRAGLEVSKLAGKIPVDPKKLQEWESGKGHPTYKQAQKLAKITRLPFGYLFLTKPVDEELGIADFRILPGNKEIKPSMDLLEVVRDARLQQSWFCKHLIAENDNIPLSCFQSSPEFDEDKIAQKIRSFFEWDDFQFKPKGNPSTFMKECVDRAHDKRFLISRSCKAGGNTSYLLDNKEFRGFAMFDECAPLVFINTRHGSPQAQLFTLALELAHLFCRESGIDSAKWEDDHKSIHAKEAACKRIAASALMPGDQFNEKWVNTNGDERQKIEKMSRIFKVSKMAAAIRAFDMQHVSKSICNVMCAEEKKRYKEYLKSEVKRNAARTERRAQQKKEGKKSNKGKKSNGNSGHFTLFCNRIPGGERFAHAVVMSVGSGGLPYHDAFGLLEGSQKNFYDCVKHLGW